MRTIYRLILSATIRDADCVLMSCGSEGEGIVGEKGIQLRSFRVQRTKKKDICPMDGEEESTRKRGI